MTHDPEQTESLVLAVHKDRDAVVLETPVGASEHHSAYRPGWVLPEDYEDLEEDSGDQSMVLAVSKGSDVPFAKWLR
jgi:hypothetical protein